VVRLAAATGVGVAAASAAWRAVEEAFALETLRAAIAAAPAPGPFGPRARAALLDEVAAAVARLAAAQLAGAAPPAERVVALVREAAAARDLAAATVAVRALAKAAGG
jgi:glutamate dehydrogenase